MRAIRSILTKTLGIAVTLAMPLALSVIMTLAVLTSSTLSGLATNFLTKAGIETAESLLTRKNAKLANENKKLKTTNRALKQELSRSRVKASEIREKEVYFTSR